MSVAFSMKNNESVSLLEGKKNVSALKGFHFLSFPAQ